MLHACDSAPYLLPFYILDPEEVHPSRLGPLPARFLLEALEDLNASLTAKGSGLLVLRGKPADILPVLLHTHSPSVLCHELSLEPGEIQEVQQGVRVLAEKTKTRLFSPVSRHPSPGIVLDDPVIMDLRS